MNGFSRRSFIRILSYLSAAVMVLVGFTAVTYGEREQYRRQLEFTYMRALQDASDLVSGISFALDKSVYAGTSAQMAALSQSVWRDSSAAKASLSSLPVSAMQLGSTYKFLSQVGDYTLSLTRKLENGQALSEQEKKELMKLRDYASALNRQLSLIQSRVSRGETALQPILSASGQDGAQDPQLGESADVPSDGFQEMEDSFSGYPTLIYDGPFSDHLLNRDPRLTQGRDEISREQARSIAAQAAGVSEASLSDRSDEDSNLPAYNFSDGQTYIGVTKAGGFLLHMANGRAAGGQQIEDEDAREQAVVYLSSIGLTGLKETYYEKANNVMTINYAHYQEGTICYTDLVKVGVALDSGGIVFFDSRGYIMNHQPRSLGAPALTAQQAQESVSPDLPVSRYRLALIPTHGGGEALCYEFYAAVQGGDEFLVYIDANTGEERQILELIQNETGILTK